MKWQAIANVTSQINEEAKGYLARKLEKDASVEIPNLWADFISNTTKHLHQSQSHLNVASNDKTGGLSCLTSFDELHEDFLEHNKPFLDYVLGKYDQRAATLLGSARNPYTKRLLQQKIGGYRTQLADQISHTEVKLIDGKRHDMALSAIEKLKNSTYDNPHFYQQHLEDSIIAINSLSLLPQEKDQMLFTAREELAKAAALGSLRSSPNIILDNNAHALWKEHLSFEQRVKLEHQATNLLHHQQAMMQQQVKYLSQAHFASILKTGEGINGFDNLMQASFAANDPKLLELKEKEALHKEAFLVAGELKRNSLSAGAEILAQMAPRGVEDNYEWREKIYHILVKQYNEQVKAANSDPAKLVEDLFSDEVPEHLPLPARLMLRKQLQEQKGVPIYNQKYLMNDERSDYLARLHLPDPNEIKKQLDNISAIGDENYQLGHALLDEILQAERGESGRRLSALTHQYVRAYLYKDNDLMHDMARAIGIQGQLFGEFSKDDERIIKKTIKDNPTLEDFEYKMLHATPDNAQQIESLKETILNLARFYQHDRHLEAGKATNLAIDEIVSKNYIKPTDDLYLPAKIIENGQIVELNSEYLNYNLSKLRADLIHDRVFYDKTHSFGQSYKDERQLIVDKRIKELLRKGQFKLTPDQKYIYFIYSDDHGSHNLLTDQNTIWHVPLIELNNPPNQQDLQNLNSEEFHELLKTTSFRH